MSRTGDLDYKGWLWRSGGTMTGALTLSDGTPAVSEGGTQTLTGKTLSGAVVAGAAPATPATNVLYTDSVVKAWVQVSFSAGSPSIDADLNISSVTDNGVGLVTLNLATAMGSANYAVATCGDKSAEVFVGTGTKTTSAIPIEITDRNGTASDSPFTVITIGQQ